MEKGKVNELFRSKFGNQRLRGFIKTRTKLLPSIKALPSLCKCLTQEVKLFLVLPAMHGGFRGEYGEPSSLSVAPRGWTPLPKEEPPKESQLLTSALAHRFKFKLGTRTTTRPPNSVPLLPLSRGEEHSFQEKSRTISR